jgi:hypothetical protein
MTRPAVLLAALALGLAAVVGLGCGSGGSGDGTIGTSAEALAKVRASDYASAVNLHAADVPYFERIPDEEDEEDPGEELRRDRELKRCIGAAGDLEAGRIAEVDSSTYGTQSPGELLRVQSSVEVVAGAGDAVRELRLFRSRRAERCLQRVYVSALEEDESGTAEVRRVSLSRLPLPVPGIEDGFGYRFKALLTVHPQTSELSAYRPGAPQSTPQSVEVYVDILGFVAGRAEVTLTATGAPAPVSKNLKRNLLRLLHERALARRP